MYVSLHDTGMYYVCDISFEMSHQVCITRRFAPLPPPDTLAHKEELRIEQNANEADREVHEFRFKLTCTCQELHARGYQPGRRMHVPGT